MNTRVNYEEKLVALFIVVISAIALSCMVAGCSFFSDSYSDKNRSVTYYAYNSYYDEIDTSDSITLNDGTWTDGSGFSGAYAVNGDKITLYIDLFGERMEHISGTLTDHVFVSTDTVYVTIDHRHSFGDEYVKQEQTCTQDEIYARKCVCGKEETRVTKEARGHKFSLAMNESCHYNICSDCGLKKDENLHAGTDKCSVCRFPMKYTSQLSAGVTEIEDYAFYNCSGLTSITIPDSVTSIGFWAFRSGLESINYTGDIESWCKISGLNNLMYDGESATKLYINGKEITGELIIPDGVTSICGSAFRGCNRLTSVTIPDSVTSIGNSAFYGCSELTSVTISDSVTSIGSRAFEACNKLIKKENGVSYVDKWVIDCDTSVTEITLKSDTNGIADSAFYNCSGLTSITISDSVTSIGFWAFRSGLESINYTGDIESWCKISGLNNLMYDGESATKLYINGKEITGELIIPDGVTSICGSAFSGCNRLTSVTIPDSVTKIDSGAFYECYGLTSITYTGTKAQWKTIEKGYVWNYGTGKYTVQCTDGKLNKNGNVVE